MAELILRDGEQLRIPGWVTDLASFRRWYDSPEFPEDGRLWWLCGQVWWDMSKEQLFTHAALKTEIAAVLRPLVKAAKTGIFFTDGPLLSNFAADICGKPDGLFVSTETLNSDRSRLIEGKESGFVELQGAPDMALEIVSDSSVHKDKRVLKQAYWEADIRDYWLIDARATPLHFDIFRHTRRGYTATPKKEGWLRSAVFDKAFRLEQEVGPGGHPDYTLLVR